MAEIDAYADWLGEGDYDDPPAPEPDEPDEDGGDDDATV